LHLWESDSNLLPYDRACLDQLLNRDQIAGKAVRSCAICRRGDRDRFKFHNIFANIWLVSRDTVPNQITLSRLTMAARYSCTVLVSVGTRHCAQCVDSLCSYLGDSDTHNAGLVGNQSQSACQTPHSVCVRRPIRFPTATDCRLYHRACLLSETIYRA